MDTGGGLVCRDRIMSEVGPPNSKKSTGSDFPVIDIMPCDENPKHP